MDINKAKYIYWVYESGDKRLHCERFPVIYMNSRYTYFKQGGRPSLRIVNTADVLGGTVSKYFEVFGVKWYGLFNKMFWNVEDGVSTILASVAEKRSEYLKQDAIETAKTKYDLALNRYRKAKEDLEHYEKLMNQTMERYGENKKEED